MFEHEAPGHLFAGQADNRLGHGLRCHPMTSGRSETIGRDRMDLCLRYGEVVLGIEIKVQRDDGRNQLVRGLAQIDGYLARLGLDFGWLVIFDRRIPHRDEFPLRLSPADASEFAAIVRLCLNGG